MIRSTHAIITGAFVNNLNCSKLDVTIVSGSQVTVRTFNDYNSTRWGWDDTEMLLIQITKVLFECTVEPA